MSDTAPAARLFLCPHAGGNSHELDGVWWPRSRATVEELAALFTGMECVGSYSRATLDRSLWPGTPRPFRIAGLGRVVRWGGFVAGQDPHRIELFSLIAPFRELLVVPPQVSPRVAALLMDPSEWPDRSRLPSELLGAALARVSGTAMVRIPALGSGEGGRRSRPRPAAALRPVTHASRSPLVAHSVETAAGP
ncbi:DUF5994 family protein [Embleya sp. NBC_00888]|uniref:DUF5994 family protein n=1 Tax=Embleya sp. NBC_00888 TaxID=2975960 RepID=UPI00386E7585